MPASNPYLATVVGTSLELTALAFPIDIPLKVRRLPLDERRAIPDVLRYGARLDYSYAKQKGPAPLIFVIAGTGAAHDSELTQFLMRAFYAAGFHVVGITSPTYPTFIIAASSTMVPGEQRHDAQDIYAVMQKIWAEIGPDMTATTFYLTGYSIGATNAAFVSLLDEERKAFNFEKVLLLDPSVQIYNSISKLDRFIENIPGRRRQLRRRVRQDRRARRRQVSQRDDGDVLARTRVRRGARRSAGQRRADRADRRFVPPRVVGTDLHVGRHDQLRLHQTGQRDPHAEHQSRRVPRTCRCASVSPTTFTNSCGRISSARSRPRR